MSIFEKLGLAISKGKTAHPTFTWRESFQTVEVVTKSIRCREPPRYTMIVYLDNFSGDNDYVSQ